MSEFDDAEFDVHEYAEQLGYTDELGRHDMSDPNIERATTKSSRGLSRRDLLVKGGLGAAALTGLGGVAGRRPRRRQRSDAYTGTLSVITLGVEWPQGAEQQAEKDLGFKFNVAADEHERAGAEVDHRAGQLRHRRSLQLPVLPDLANGQLPAGRPDEDQGVEQLLPASSRKGKVLPGRKDCTPGQGNAPFRVLYLDPNAQRRAFRSPRKGRATTRQIVQWWNDAANAANGGKPQPRYDRRGRRPTSTWTRWATTATSSRSSRARSRGPSSSTAG